MINNSTSFCVIGNCQSNPISIFVEKISPQFKRVLFPAIHLIDLSKLDRIWEILDKVDIIIHQPISDSFGELGIESLMLKYPDKKYVSFPSVYFDGYFPYLGYLRRPAGGTVKGVLGDYHDFRVLEAFLQGKGKKEICAILNSKSSKKVIENNINNSLERLRVREELLDVKINTFIKNNVFSMKLFHVFNHPSNAVMIYIAQEIVKNLGGELTPITTKNEALGSVRFPVDSYLIDYFGKNQERSYTLTTSRHNEVVLNQNEFVEKQLEIYKKTGGLKQLYKYALKRRELIGY
jgi:hypothetical protein